jgi:hypothetical protein
MSDIATIEFVRFLQMYHNAETSRAQLSKHYLPADNVVDGPGFLIDRDLPVTSGAR